jgi:uncharacterized membrane protein
MADSWGEKLTASISVLTLGLGVVAAVLGVNNWWLIFVVGWLVLTPLSAILFDVDDEADHAHEPTSPPTMSEEDVEASTESGESTQDALDTLRDRYARGELSEEQFERKLEKLLQTETVEDARDRMADAAERSSEREAERDADREHEPER